MRQREQRRDSRLLDGHSRRRRHVTHEKDRFSKDLGGKNPTTNPLRTSLEIFGLVLLIPTAIMMWVDAYDRKSQRVATAWESITRVGVSGNTGKASSLNYLHKKGILLVGIDLSVPDGSAYTYLHGLRLSGADLTNANLSRTDLTGSDLSYVVLKDTNFNHAIMKNVTMNGVSAERVAMKGVDLFSAKLASATLSRADFSNSSGRKTDFSGSDLRSVNFTGADFQGATLNNASVNDSSFVNADFQSASFVNTKLPWSDFENANLQNTDFTGANLKFANFEGAIISGILLKDTRLEGITGCVKPTSSCPEKLKTICC